MLYRISRFFLRSFFRIFVGFRISGAENVPVEGGFILAPNHTSYMDPPVVGSACPRKVHFMAKIELFSVPLLAEWMRGVGVIALQHGVGDRASLKKAVQLLKEGHCVCIFPEGRRVPSGMIQEAEQGVAYLAKLANVPIVPAAILGTQPWYRKFFGVIPWFHPLEVRFGKKMDLTPENSAGGKTDKHTILKNAAEKVLVEIRKLKADG